MYVCQQCIEDANLQEIVRTNAVSRTCDYCKAESTRPIACELDDVVERVWFAIYQEYSSPDEETLYDSDIGDFFGTVMEHTEVFDDIGFDLANRDLYDDIVECFRDERFCRKGMLSGSLSERQMDAWDGFKEIIKHQRRYTFWSIEDADYGVIEHPPSEIVANIARTISQFGLIREAQQGTAFWRVRVHEPAVKLTEAIELAAPNSEQSVRSNRMSPAGVSMFYGADDLDTAIVETVAPDSVEGKVLTGCQFTNLRSLRILDLSQLPSYSFFSLASENERQGVAFLRAFQDDVSKPVERDGREHIDYVPTQVFTEYVRYELTTDDAEPIDGICYRSSKNSRGCYALFCDQEDCLSNLQYRRRDQQLQFDSETLIRLDQESLEQRLV